MKLSEYIKKLQINFEVFGEMECYYSKDDEGNGFQKVNYDPSVMLKNKRDNERDAELFNLDEEKEELEESLGIEDDEDIDVYDLLEKVICVN